MLEVRITTNYGELIGRWDGGTHIEAHTALVERSPAAICVWDDAHDRPTIPWSGAAIAKALVEFATACITTQRSCAVTDEGRQRWADDLAVANYTITHTRAGNRPNGQDSPAERLT